MPRTEAQLLRIIRLHVELASFLMDPNDELEEHVIKVEKNSRVNLKKLQIFD